MQITEEIEILFNYNDPPNHDFLLEPRPASQLSRIRQLLQDQETGASNLPDLPNQYETREWEDDFEFKASSLRSAFQQRMPEDLYIELYGSLESKCHVLADERKMTARSYYELERIIEEHGDVFLYNQEFRDREVDPLTGQVKWYPKTYDALTGFRCFVEDIDNVDASNIRSVIEMIMAAPILPNYVNLTGNGLHLYFLFDAIHDMKYSAWRRAFVDGTSIDSERQIYVTIKQGMIAWFNGSTAKSDIRNHLAQPSRLAGSKTKNRNKRTILFKVSDTKHSIQHIAGLFGIDLPDEESIRQWRKVKEAEWKQERKKRQQNTPSSPASLVSFFGSDGSEPQPVVVVDKIGDDACVVVGDLANPNSKYRFSFVDLVQRVVDDADWPKDSPEARFYEEQRRVRAEKKARAASPEGQKRKIAQRRGLESQYTQFKQYCYDVARQGNRGDLLHIFWNRAPIYQNDHNVIQRDFDDLFFYCNSLHHTEVTKKQYDSIVNGNRIKYSDESISRRLGVELKFRNKSKEEMLRKREEKANKWACILMICEAELLNNPLLSDRKLTAIIKSQGIQVCHKTISTCADIKELRARLRIQ